MSENLEKDVLDRSFMSISLLSEKIRIGIVGGGRVALIKTGSFLKMGCYVEVLAADFRKEFYGITSDRLFLNHGKYNREFIIDKHIIVIAVDHSVKERIILDCEEMNKIYVVCSDFKNGNAVIPSQDSTSCIHFSVNTKEGNPRAAVFLKGKIHRLIEVYDDFVSYTSYLRKKFRDYPEKDVIMNFVNSEDFYYFFKRGKGDLVLKLFFGRLIYDKGCNPEKPFGSDTGRPRNYEDKG